MANKLSIGVIIGICIGISIGLVVGGCILIWYKLQSKGKKEIPSTRGQQCMQLPLRVNGLSASSVLSDITIDSDSPPHGKKKKTIKSWFAGRHGEKNAILSHSGLPVFPYRYSAVYGSSYCIRYNYIVRCCLRASLIRFLMKFSLSSYT